MKVNKRKLDLILAQRCMNLRELRTVTSLHTLSRIRRWEDVLPATLGRVAKALGVDPADIVAEE